MEHCINIEERVNPYPTEPKVAHANVAESIEKEIKELPPLNLFPKPCIYKVQDGLREVKRAAYTPMLLSIGPYHLKKANLCPLREHKLRYLHSILERIQEKSVLKYILKLKELEAKARKYYADPIDDLKSDEFVEMLLLDGFFIIEFALKASKMVTEGIIYNDDPIFNVNWMENQIRRDMVLLENQLPYFVLLTLYDMTKDPEEEMPFEKMAMCIFFDILPKAHLSSPFLARNNLEEIKHLVHLVHALCQPLSDSLISEGDNDMTTDQMHSAVELQEAGVKFKKTGELKSYTDELCLFEIKFDHGLMEIPCFKVDDWTDTFFRNLIAYEQHSSDVKKNYFTDYAIFMDQLINSEKDVNLLRGRRIIANLLGDDEEVSLIFNSLCDGVVGSSNFYYSGVRKKVNAHCEKWLNAVMAKLRGDYFNNPWASVSTVAAGVLLGLTVIQTVMALKGVMWN